jgi:hypothetical protein
MVAGMSEAFRATIERPPRHDTSRASGVAAGPSTA